jgi:hypothetical protein
MGQRTGRPEFVFGRIAGTFLFTPKNGVMAETPLTHPPNCPIKIHEPRDNEPYEAEFFRS